MTCLQDKLYDDVRVIKLFSAALFFSLSELSDRCERALEESKLRYPLLKDSPAVLINLKKPVKRSLLVSKNESKKGFPTDTLHDHCYPGLQAESKKILKKEKKKSNLKAKCSATSPDGEGEAKLKNSTGIDSLSVSSLKDEADTVCANADERKCQIDI